jgi:hypothetical protein
MATLYTEKEFKPLDSIMAPLYCHTLNLNQSFSRAILQGSMSLSGIGGPLAGQQIMRIRLNYFLYNISQKDIS